MSILIGEEMKVRVTACLSKLSMRSIANLEYTRIYYYFSWKVLDTQKYTWFEVTVTVSN